MNRGVFHTWNVDSSKNLNESNKIKTMNLNFGPQHPAAHGVLRMILQLNGEVIEKSDPHIGLLHRGSEKLMEDKFFLQSLPYFDRFDYVSMLAQEHGFCLGIEGLNGKINTNSIICQVRTIFDELTRILNHMLAIACHALDVGSMSSIFWAFEEREKIMEFYERVSGARMHAAFYRPNELNYESVSNPMLEDITKFSEDCLITLNEMHNVLTYNKIWKQRLINIGSYSYKTCMEYGLTGVLARCTGVKRDLRLSKLESYANYPNINFKSYIGQKGDCYDRFLIRMCEMIESLNIINQTISKTNSIKNSQKFKETNSVFNVVNFVSKSSKDKKTYSHNFTMESVINEFKYWSENDFVGSGVITKTIESPKGEFGVILLSDGSNKPYKVKVRSPAYHHMQVCPKLAKGHFLADLVALVSTIDIVFGEIDR